MLLAAALAGCSLAPNYARPESPVGGDWPEKGAGSASAAPVSEMAWRTFFTNATLQRLIGDALANNRDLRVAALNMERAAAQYRIQRADRLPTVGLSGDHASQRVAEDLSLRGGSYIGRQYTVGLGVSGFELDFFGRVKSLSDAALEQYFASEEAHRAARLSLVSQVAAGWLQLLADREQLAISRETLASQQASYGMIKSRYEHGVSSRLDLWQAQSSVDTARANIARYTGQIAEDINALSILVGRQVSGDEIPERTLSEAENFPALQAGLPSDVLLGRPDILMQEHLLRAANANIGAARANFFPRITLTGALGRGSVELDNLFDAHNGTWLFSPSISLPIFDMGRNLARLRASEKDRDIAVANYEKSIQQAFREVADSLTLRRTLEEQLAARLSLVRATTESYRLSNARYQSGVDSYLSVLVTQREMFAAQLASVAVRLARDVNLVTLYKALGGGWK
ncbi:MAG: efflux transporter outer membrane subunit [Desulfovibrionaceae bacterium]|nr:efflux transporter outer membrane subunit [Desulfovibrionaceae bacterium]